MDEPASVVVTLAAYEQLVLAGYIQTTKICDDLQYASTSANGAQPQKTALPFAACSAAAEGWKRFAAKVVEFGGDSFDLIKLGIGVRDRSGELTVLADVAFSRSYADLSYLRVLLFSHVC